MAFVEKKCVPHFKKEEVEAIHKTMDIVRDLRHEDDSGDLWCQVENNCEGCEWQWLYDMLYYLCDGCEVAD
jgi:glutaredoxin 2